MVELNELRFVLWFVLPAIGWILLGYVLRMVDERREKQALEVRKK